MLLLVIQYAVNVSVALFFCHQSIARLHLDSLTSYLGILSVIVFYFIHKKPPI